MRKKLLLYFHDGKSVYDDFFLKFLTEHFDVHFATFSKSGAERIGRNDAVKVHLLRELPLELPVHDTIRGLAMTPFRVPIFGLTVKTISPDVLVACWATTYGFYAHASRSGAYALMGWGSDILLQPNYLPLKALATGALKGATKVFLDSDVQELAAIHLGCNRGAIIKFPWVNLSWLTVLHVDKETFRRGLGIGSDDKIVIFNRRHDPVYDPGTFVDAAAEVLANHPKVFFLMAGQGRLSLELKEKVRRRALGDRFKFLGWVEKFKLAEYVGASDIYASTSLSDGTSASLLEAMALGVVPVVTRISGNREWVSDGVNGLLFDKKDVHGLAASISRLLDDEAFRKSVGVEARKTVMARADWKVSSRSFLAGLRAVEEIRKR